MYLKSVELYGFKSFPGKIFFQFDHGITAIVGPNGSGKSNIADAVRWVLGEQSAKQLRGSNMQDIIFAGTEARKPLSYCQVDITIDNRDQSLPISYQEVKISRRVYRSGESEYCINGSACRLKDIQALFFDTGVGKEGYSIIGQGQIEKILSAKPEDRRSLFDEAAGIVKYKERKAVTVRKLEEEQRDLERISDIVEELKRQESTLEAQSVKTKEFLKLRDDLRVYEVNTFLRLMDTFEEQSRSLEEKQKLLTAELKEKQESFALFDSQYQSISEELAEKERQQEESNERANAKKIELERIRGEIRLDEERIRYLKAGFDQHQQTVDSLYEQILQFEKDLVSIQYEHQSDQKLLQELKQDLQQTEEIKNRMEAEIAGLKSEHLTLQKEKLLQVEKKAEREAEIQKIELNWENEKKQAEAMKSRSLLLLQVQKVLKQEIAELQTQEDGYHAEQDSLLKKKMESDKKRSQRNQKLQELRERLRFLERNYREKETRHHTLQEMEQNYEGYFGSVKDVLDRKNKGVIGVVADILEVPRKYQKAIETALGNRLQNIITTTDAVAAEEIAYLKKHRLGRATFLPMNTVTGNKAKEITGQSGYLGIASDLVQYDRKYENILQNLLGNLFVTESLSQARELAAKHHQKLRIITLEGDILNPGGSMTGGEIKNSGSMFFSRKNEIEELGREMIALEKEVSQLSLQIQEIESADAEAYREMEEILASERRVNQEMDRLILFLEQKRRQSSESLAEMEEIRRKEADFLRIQQQYQKAKSELIPIVEASDWESKEEKLLDALSILEDDWGCQHEDFMKLTTQIVALEEKFAHIEDRKQSIRDAKEAAFHQREARKEELSAVHLERLKKEQQLSGLKERERICQQEQEKAEAESHLQKNEKSVLKARKENLQNSKEEYLKELSLLEKEHIRQQSQMDRLKEQKAEQADHLWSEYELTYSTARQWENTDLGSDTSLRQMVRKTKESMKALGDVNLTALTEYEEVKERLDFTISQREDLLKAEEKLRALLFELEQEMREKFVNEFKAVNQRFSMVFQELFGGGTGYLALTEEDNILESGIAIHVQPPGKKLKNMMLLSGGERAFTAIALLFAIQSLKPSPFCILDEIEAALDDANVYKFAQYLKKLAGETQFIIITHRKGTMESADTLYGITMQEKGVSTQVSVKMIENDLDKEE